MDKYLNIGDIINGKSAQVTAVIDGRVEDLFFVTVVDAKAEKNKIEKNVLGFYGTQQKAVGWKGTGKIQGYYISEILRKLMFKYINTGVDTYFTLTITNDDPSSTAGVHRVVLERVNIDSAELTKVDVNSTALEEEYPFTFSGAKLLDEFGKVL